MKRIASTVKASVERANRATRMGGTMENETAGNEAGGTAAEERSASSLRPKARQILDAALRLFLAKGFDLVSTDQIAQEAGVSKATVYAYFPSKEELFSEVILSQCAEFTALLPIPTLFEGDFEGNLVRIGSNLLGLFSDKQRVSLYRLLVGEVHRFPKLALTFEQTGPAVLQQRMGDYFRQAAAHGTIAIADPSMAADLFLDLVLGRLPFDQALGLPPWSEDKTRDRVRAAVAIFLYGIAAR